MIEAALMKKRIAIGGRDNGVSETWQSGIPSGGGVCRGGATGGEAIPSAEEVKKALGKGHDAPVRVAEGFGTIEFATND